MGRKRAHWGPGGCFQAFLAHISCIIINGLKLAQNKYRLHSVRGHRTKQKSAPSLAPPLLTIVSHVTDCPDLHHLFPMDQGAAGRAPGLGARKRLGVTWVRLGTLAEPQSACLSSGSILVSPRSPVSGERMACVSVTFLCPAPCQNWCCE